MGFTFFFEIHPFLVSKRLDKCINVKSKTNIDYVQYLLTKHYIHKTTFNGLILAQIFGQFFQQSFKLTNLSIS